jgi:riboflavin synthase
MFTGIVAGSATVTALTALSTGLQLRIRLPGANIQIATGDSIALNGVCTTAIDIDATGFSVQLLQETLKKTSFKSIKVGDSFNWELSATPTTALGGHLVYGHVDEVGTISTISDEGPFKILSIAYSPQFRVFLIPKGSICINGISLTVVDVSATHFSCHIIPHTIANTGLYAQKSGNLVNLEYDIVAKYLYNFHSFNQGASEKSLLDTLNKAGYL